MGAHPVGGEEAILANRSTSGEKKLSAGRARRTCGIAVAVAFGLASLLASAPAGAEVEPALSLELGSPQKLSANLGIRIGLVGPNEPDYGKGLLLQLQPGLGGGAVNLGWAPVALPAWGSQAVGFVVKARLLRTWGDPWAIEPDQTFAGGEVGLAWIVKVSFGVLTRVSSGGSGKKTTFTWSIGVGL